MAETVDQVQVTVPARAAALAWLNAFLAASDEEDRPTLYKTLCLEVFDDGVQMIGCDGTALFRAWVPCEADGDPAKWPTNREAPTRKLVVMDPDGFGLGYMRTLLRVTGEEEHQFEPLHMAVVPHDEDPTISLGAEFMSERLILRACGQRMDLRLYEGQYPDWRSLSLGVADLERVDGLTVATRLFALVGKLRGVNRAELEFFGDSRHVAFTARGIDTEVRGLLMPMRKAPE